MHLLCPHCHNPIELADLASGKELVCPSCGSSFQLERGSITTDWQPRKLGKFELLEEVGIGAFGTVYKARDPELDRVVAIKIPRTGNLATGDDLDRFLREARSVAQLRHHGIVPVHEVGQQERVPYLVSDFVQGITLADQLAVRRPGFREAAELIAAVADALQYAHEQGVVHRDVKPSNIMLETVSGGVVSGKEEDTTPGSPLTTHHSPKLMDFGLAKREAGEITMTIEGQVLGTPAYMSPEQARGESHLVDGRSDVYSLGVILYRMLTGELPFRGNTRMLLHQVLHDEPPSPRSLNDRIPRDLETICLKAMAKEPARRYATARELADDVRCFLAGEPILARPVTASERLVKWVKRRPALAALLLVSAVAALALVGVGVGLVYSRQLLHARLAEERQRQRAEAALEQSNTYLYFHRISLAERNWWANNVGRTKALLAECPEERRLWEWHYLNRLCHSELLTLVGHTNDIHSAAFSTDGKRLASASLDHTVKIWDAVTGRELVTLSRHTAPVAGVVISPDGTRIVSVAGFSGPGGELKIWQVDSSPPSGGAVRARELLSLAILAGERCRPALSPDGHLLAVASGVMTGPAQVHVFEVASGKELLTLATTQEGVTGVAFSPDGKRLAAAGGSSVINPTKAPGFVQVWDANSGKELARFRGDGSAVHCVAFSPDGRYLASAGRDKIAKLWDALTYQPVRVLRGHTADVMSLAFRPDGLQLATGSEDGTVKVWDVAIGEELYTLRGHTAEVYTVAYHPDGHRLVSGSGDHTLRLWDVTTSQEARTLRQHDGTVSSVTFSPDGRWLASGSQDRTVQLWEPGTANKPRTLGKHNDPVWGIAFSPDGTQLASAAGDWHKREEQGEVKVWDAATGREELRLQAHIGLAWSVAFSPEGGRLATAGGELTSPGEVTLWAASTGRKLHTFPQPKGVRQVVFSPDGERVAGISTRDNALKAWSVTTGEELLNLRASSIPSTRVWSVAFSPDGQWLATGDSDQAVKIWDGKTGQLFRTLRGHTSDVLGLAFSPDGQRLASAGYDQTVKMWDVATGEEALTLRGHAGPVWAVAFSPDGWLLASGGADGTVKIWNATPLDDKAAKAVAEANSD